MRFDQHKSKSLLVLAIFLLISAALFAPSFDRGFVSDDYCILDFLFNNNGYLVRGFFRPVGDLTLKWTYIIAGADPWYFYLVNALLHGFNAWLVYEFCRKVTKEGENKDLPVAAALIFLCYHSLGEVVLWTIGRGISLAVTFGLLAMIAFASRINATLKYVVVCVCYFIALSAYESVVLLPVILLLTARIYRIPVNFFRWTAALSFTLAANLFLRVGITGKLWASYKGLVWAKSGLEYVTTWIKSLFRLFVPAFNQPVAFTVVALIVLGILTFLLLRRKGWVLKQNIVQLALAGIVSALLIVMFYGASTRTSEGDRLLYWPAVFASILTAAVILRTIPGRVVYLVLFCIIGVQVYFLKSTQSNWIKADRLSNVVIKQIAEAKERPVYLINLPSEHNGAFMFRNCFEKALQFHGIDPSQVHVVNKLNFSASAASDGTIARNNKYVDIKPNTRLVLEGNRVVQIENGGDVINLTNVALNNVAYWTKDSLVYLGDLK